MVFRRRTATLRRRWMSVPIGSLIGGTLIGVWLIVAPPCASVRPALGQIFATAPTALTALSNVPQAQPYPVTWGSSSASLRFGPNGQLYAWDGTYIYEQTGGLTTTGVFTTIGSITPPPTAANPTPTTPFNSDPGPINFSANGQTVIVSTGAGGPDSTAPAYDSNGLFFTLPITGGATTTPVGGSNLISIPTENGSDNVYPGAVPNTFDVIPVPIGSKTTSTSPSKFFVDVGNGTGSEVDLFNATTGTDVPLLTGIPGASTSLAISGTNWSNYTLYAGVGSGSQQGQIEAFNVATLFHAIKSGTPLTWSAGTTVDPPDSNNSGSGMFVDPRGYVFSGGPVGVEVVAPGGNTYVYSIPYDANGDSMTYASVSYSSITNQFAVQGYDYSSSFPLQQAVIYSASQFGVAATNLLNWTGANSGGGSNHSWDASSTNWASNSSTVTYADGDTVIFGDTNPYSPSAVSNTNHIAQVQIAAGGVNPAAVMFTNSGAANAANGGVDYTICGGPIGGAATLELYGNGTVGGTVNLMSPNAFTGPVIVAAGTLNLQNTAALGNSSGVSVIAGATLQLQSSGSGTFGLTVSNASSIPLNLYGTGITANAGELNSFSGNNIYAGAINVGSGGGQIVSTSTTGNDQLALSGGVNVSAGATLTIAGPGATTISGAGLTLGNTSALQVASGTLTIALTAGTGTVSLGSGATATVAADATLQLAGSVSAFSDATSGNRINIVNDGSTATGGGLLIASGNQTVGTISGSGDTVVAAGATLTADQILQNTLTIGAGAVVTILPSGSGSSAETGTTETAPASASGNSLSAIQAALSESSTASPADTSQPLEKLQDRVAILSRLAATNPAFDTVLSNAENSLRSLEVNLGGNPTELADLDGLLSFDASEADSSSPLASALPPSADFNGTTTAVPEPPTSVLLLIAGLFMLRAPFVAKESRTK